MRIRELFPFGDVDDTLVSAAGARFPDLEVDRLASALYLGKAVVEMLEWIAAPLEEEGLSPAQWRLLIALLFQAGSAGATVGELAEHLGVKAPTATTTVRRAERAGLVERRQDSADRRVVRVNITARGAQRVVSLEPVLAARLSGFVKSLGGPVATRRLAQSIRSATAAADTAARES